MRACVCVLGAALLAGCAGVSAERASSSGEALVQCPASALEGIDVSQAQGLPDWAAVAASGVAFAWIKATQGTYDTQSTFADQWTGAAAAGLVRGAYHFFDPTEDGAAQALHFLSVVGPLAGSDLPPMVDVECPDGDANCLFPGAAGDTPAPAIGARLRDCLRVIEENTGRTPVLYTFRTYFASNAIATAGLSAFPLFLAAPTSAPCFDVPAPWERAVLWQYAWTGAVPGVVGSVDRDRLLVPMRELLGARTADAAGPPEADGSASSTADAFVASGRPDALDGDPPTAAGAEGPDDGAATGGHDTGAGRASLASSTVAGEGCAVAYAQPPSSPIALVLVVLARAGRRGQPGRPRAGRLPTSQRAC